MRFAGVLLFLLLVTNAFGGAPGTVSDTALGPLPASFSGDLPCADCPGIRYQLDLLPDRVFFLRMTYLEKGRSFDAIGAWAVSSDDKTLILKGGREAPDRFTIKDETILRKLDLGEDIPVLVKLPAVDFVNDKAGKPIGIQKFIGRRPILAFGNSDGDHQMLQWTAAGSGPRFMGLVHHTDAEREWAYDRKSHIGMLDKALDEATAKRWAVVDMKKDWNRVFPFEETDANEPAKQ